MGLPGQPRAGLGKGDKIFGHPSKGGLPKNLNTKL